TSLCGNPRDVEREPANITVGELDPALRAILRAVADLRHDRAAAFFLALLPLVLSLDRIVFCGSIALRGVSPFLGLLQALVLDDLGERSLGVDVVLRGGCGQRDGQ